jgi:hypothetical protein
LDGTLEQRGKRKKYNGRSRCREDREERGRMIIIGKIVELKGA